MRQPHIHLIGFTIVGIIVWSLCRPHLHAKPVDIIAEGKRFIDVYTRELPNQTATTWRLPFHGAQRRDMKAVRIVSTFGSARRSYVRGHIHTGLDLMPAEYDGSTAVEVKPIAPGVVCSIHLAEPHTTVVVRHRLHDGSYIFSSYKHLAQVLVKNGQQVGLAATLGRLYTRVQAERLGGAYDHLHLEIRRRFDDYGVASWTTMTRTELLVRFYDPYRFLLERLGEASGVYPTAFDRYLEVERPLAAGFRMPVKHGRRALNGQQAYAMGAGEVTAIRQGQRGKVLEIEHLYYENHRKKLLKVTYQCLRRVGVVHGQMVKRGAIIGKFGRCADGAGRDGENHVLLTLSQVELQFQNAVEHRRAVAEQQEISPAPLWPKTSMAQIGDFVRTRRWLYVPQHEKALLLLDHATYRMRYYTQGSLAHEYEIAFGQNKGRKRLRGDHRTPKGMYFVTHKYKGTFGGEYGAYFGGHWLAINYPNPWDAAYGMHKKLNSAAQVAQIRSQWLKRARTQRGLGIGSGIGFHGWVEEWDAAVDGQHLSWGCIVLHNRDIGRFYAEVQPKTMVVIW